MADLNEPKSGSWARAHNQESEATRFASEVLLPQRWLEVAAASAGDVADLIAACDSSGASAAAVVLRLSNALLPGVVLDVPGELLLPSRGTVIPRSFYAGGWVDREELRKAAVDYGSRRVGGKRVSFYELIDRDAAIDAPRLLDDPRSDTDLVLATIETHHSGLNADERMVLFRRINGIVAGTLSRERMHELTQLVAYITHRVSESEYSDLLEYDEFQAYLWRKCQARVTSLGL
jgi:hypothetical protein